MTGTLAGKLAVVTGASSGIGRAIALQLATQGAAVWLLARRGARLTGVAAEIEQLGGKAWTQALDVGSEPDVRRFADGLAKATDGLDVLVHSAGLHIAGRVADAPASELDAQYQVNVRGPYVLTQLLLPLLVARQGQVVFVNSSAGLNARGGVSGYTATKHALRALADALRDEVNADGVRVLSVYPGRTATPQQEAIHAAEGKLYRPERLLQPEDVADVVVNALTVARTAEVTDISIRPMQKA